ncbi:anti-sigma factor domain-containing protein [Actinomycetospora sp. CA-101289]|uniref:anti-sigma factor domain-containing protein n=1 Tax=Actinomycetospora sp. CA-101289 TaxID=3239893 RepID=UPI003D95E1BD
MSDDAVPQATADHTDDHDALAVGWALHALDAEDEADFAAHLATCERCRQTVDETLETFGGIAEALEPAAPPPALRARLLDAVAQEAADSAAEDEDDDVPVSGEVPPTIWSSSPRRTRDDEREASAPVPASGGSPRHASVVPLRRRRATRWLAVAAAVVVLAAVGGLAVATQSLRSERDAAAAQAQRDAVVVDVLRDAGTPGVVHATLADPQGALVGVVVDDGSGPRVLTTGLGANGAEEVYVLWGIADATPRPLGTFDVTEQAPSVRSVPSAAEAAPLAGYAVSLEPGRTAPASPTRVVASGQVGR